MMSGERVVMVTTMVVMVATLSAGGSLSAHSRTHSRRDGALEPCQQAAQSLHQLLEMNDQWMVSAITAGYPFDEVFQHFAGFNYADFSAEGLMCSLKDVTTAQEALDILTASPRQYLFRMFKVIYDGASALQANKKESQPPGPLFELMSHLQATGVTEIDPDGRDWLTEFVKVYVDFNSEFPDPEPLSTQPISTQCDVLTNDVRKVWNALVENIGIPDAGVFLRRNVYLITGIQIPTGPGAHNQMMMIICDIAFSRSLEELYHVIQRLGIQDSLLHFIYTSNVEAIKWSLSQDYSDIYDDYPHNNQPNAVIDELLRNIQDMGLLDLQ